jgi:hypothetical protein
VPEPGPATGTSLRRPIQDVYPFLAGPVDLLATIGLPLAELPYAMVLGALGAVTAGSVLTTGASAWDHDGRTVPRPTVDGPIEGQPQTGAVQDLGRYGYLEEEYVISGEARPLGPVNPYPEAERENPSSDPAAYRTRLLVYRPERRHRFDGTAVVEGDDAVEQVAVAGDLVAVVDLAGEVEQPDGVLVTDEPEELPDRLEDGVVVVRVVGEFGDGVEADPDLAVVGLEEVPGVLDDAVEVVGRGDVVNVVAPAARVAPVDRERVEDDRTRLVHVVVLEFLLDFPRSRPRRDDRKWSVSVFRKSVSMRSVSPMLGCKRRIPVPPGIVSGVFSMSRA